MHLCKRKIYLQTFLISVTILTFFRFAFELPSLSLYLRQSSGHLESYKPILRQSSKEQTKSSEIIGNMAMVEHANHSFTFSKERTVHGAKNVSKLELRKKQLMDMMDAQKRHVLNFNNMNDLYMYYANDNSTDNASDIEAYYRLPSKVITPLNYKLILSNPHLCSRKPFMVLLVPSSVANFEAREGIRSTYARFGIDKPVYSSVQRGNVSVCTVFIVGRSANKTVNELVRQEFGRFKDVVLGDFMDSYFNLTLKVLLGLKWIRENVNGVHYVVKADDDVFVNIPLLLARIEKHHSNKNGNVYGTVIAKRGGLRVLVDHSKWGINKTEYPLNHYPSYAQGTSYTITGNLVGKIVNTAQHLPYLHIEDAFITGIIASKIHGAQLVRIYGNSDWGDSNPRPCIFVGTKRVAQTKMTPAIMTEIWEKLDKLDECKSEMQYFFQYGRNVNINQFPSY